MQVKNTIFVILTVLCLIIDILGLPLKFPEENTSKSIQEFKSYPSISEEEARFHHHNKYKKKKKKKKPSNCSSTWYRLRREADEEGRTFFWTGINIYDTNYYYGYPGNHNNNPLYGLGSYGNNNNGCGSYIGGHHHGHGHGQHGNRPSLGSSGGSGTRPGFGSQVPGIVSSISNGINNIGGNLPSIGSNPLLTSPKPSIITTSTSGNGDGDTDEDYDYSEGDSNTATSKPAQLGGGLGNFGNGNIASTINNAIKPVYERPERYFDRYVWRPINQTIKQIYRWFR